MALNKVESMLPAGSYYFSGDEAVTGGAIAARCRYFAGYPPIRHMANIESAYTCEGTNNTHALILGHDITGIPAFKRTL